MSILGKIKNIFGAKNESEEFEDSINKPCSPDNEERKKYLQDMKKFFDASLVREIYYDDMISICNIADCCYAIFDYVICKEMEIPCGFVLEAKYLSSVMANYDRFYKWIATIPEKERNNHIIYCGEKTYKAMVEKKRQTELNGPLVNLEYEKILVDRYGVK